MLSFFARKATQEIALTISIRTFIKVLLLIVATIAVLSLISRTEFAVTLIVVSLLLAVALHAPVTLVARHLPGKLRDSRSLATALAYLLVVAVIAVFVVSAVPPIVHQTEQFVHTSPAVVDDLRSRYHDINDLINHYNLQPQVTQLTNDVNNWLRGLTSDAFGAITNFLSSLFAIITVLVLTFMMLVEGPAWLKFFDLLVPDDRREHLQQLRHDMYRVVRGYVNGQVLLALIASLLILPGLLIFHVSYPVALMAVVFICGLIPMVGHTIGAGIVSIIALFHSPFSAIGILVYYILYQQVENYLIQPRLQATTTNLSPLLVLISVLVGVSFGGLLGGLLIIPVVACLRVLALDYLHDRYDLSDSALPGNMLKR